MVRNSDPSLDGHSVALPDSFTQAALGILERQIDTAVADNPELLTLDLSDVSTVDSAALNWLLATQSRLSGLGIQLVLRHPSPLATDVLTATRLENRFQVSGNPRNSEARGG